MSYTVNTHHIIFRTFRGRCVIPEENKRVMLKYIYVMCKNMKWHIHRMNCCRNHIHMLIDLPGDVAPGKAMQTIKPAVTKAFKFHYLFPNFQGWGEGYASFSIGPNDMERVTNYIANQEEHHLKLSLRNEVLTVMREYGILPDEYFDNQFPLDDEL